MTVRADVGVYDCSGLRVACELPLAAPRSLLADPSTADVVVELGESATPPFERPSADVVAELVVEGGPFYTICRVEGGYRCRLPGVVDFAIDEDLRRVVCHPVPDGRPDVIPIVITGTVTAFLLAMGGRTVLHGSAVDIGGRALSFVGASGQGKSTMAAMFCATGTPLVTDDVLPLEFETQADGRDVVHCLRAGNEIRLRHKSASLTDRFGTDASVRITADDRHAIEPAPTRLDRIPLAAIVLPRPDRDHTEVAARVLGAGEASLWLGRCQRIEGWQGADHLRQQFVDIGRVVASVPVIEVWVPWGPPFAEDLPARILDVCGLDDTRVS
jgi:hypothetical protein